LSLMNMKYKKNRRSSEKWEGRKRKKKWYEVEVIMKWLELLPMTINGVISRVVYLHGKPQMIETSARIHRGVSGGLLTNL
jgi:hypothetical protein